MKRKKGEDEGEEKEGEEGEGDLHAPRRRRVVFSGSSFARQSGLCFVGVCFSVVVFSDSPPGKLGFIFFNFILLSSSSFLFESDL